MRTETILTLQFPKIGFGTWKLDRTYAENGMRYNCKAGDLLLNESEMQQLERA